MSIKYRFSTEKDTDKIVELLSSNGNSFNWSYRKYHYYYSEYPEGKPISIVADDYGKIVGHFGIFPVKVGDLNVMTGHAAYVDVKYRNIKVISGIFKKIDQVCIDLNIDVLWGAANHEFAPVLTGLFYWVTIGYVSFENVKKYEIEKYADRYKFIYSNKWYQWKFSEIKDLYVQDYKKDRTTYHQLLKTMTTKTLIAQDYGFPHFNCWAPKGYSKEKFEGWSQPICIKILNSNVSNDILDIKNWFIEMGDYDAFEWMKIQFLRQG